VVGDRWPKEKGFFAFSIKRFAFCFLRFANKNDLQKKRESAGALNRKSEIVNRNWIRGRLIAYKMFQNSFDLTG